MEEEAVDQTGEGPEWDGVVRRSATLTVRAVDEERRAIDFLVSTEIVDAHGDIVEQDWDLDRYKKNPIVLWAHRRYGAPGDIIVGRSENVRVGTEGLETTVIFARVEESEVGDKAFRLVKGGFLRATSVGFRPHKVRLDTIDDDREVYRLSGNELMEISIVPIPSNPDAVAKGAAHVREQERAFLRSLAEKSTGRKAPEQLPLLEGSMNEDEKKALEDAKVAAKAADKRADELNKELKAARAELDAAKKTAQAAEERAKAAEAQLKEAETARVESEVDAMVGKKITPAEKDEYVQLAKDIGLDRVQAIVKSRPDLNVTDPKLNLGIKDGNAPRESVNDDDADDYGKSADEINRLALS